MVSTVQSLVQMTCEHLSKGLYCLLFGYFWRIQLRKANRWRGVVFFYALTVNFILCTAYFIITIITVQFLITVSHKRVDIIVQISWLPMSFMNDVQLIFELPRVDVCAERVFIGIRLELDDHRK